MNYRPGINFLHIPGPTYTPDRILRAMGRHTIDHRGAEFGQLARGILDDLKPVFKTTGDVVLWPGSGSGAWEAAFVNTLSPGDRVLMFETGQFAALWAKMACDLGFDVELVATDWRHGADPALVASKLAEDKQHKIKAVCIVHNETATGVTSRLRDIRRAIDSANHPALYLVDGISSIASLDFRMDEWQIDVAICGSQKGFMAPPGIGFNAISPKAFAASQTAKSPKSYWSWEAMFAQNKNGFFPYTPPTNLLYGLRAALDMLKEEGLENVVARHALLAEGVRRAVRAWGLEINAVEPAERSNTVTAILLPPGYEAEALRNLAIERFNLSLGLGFGPNKSRIFRIGHVGDLNELMTAGALGGVAMSLKILGVPYDEAGVNAALAYYADHKPGKNPELSAT